jgi:hypothetical protein
MLPTSGEVKLIYELPKVHEYKIYNQKGDLIAQKTGQFVDYTNYEKGTYFIAYADKKEHFTRE